MSSTSRGPVTPDYGRRLLPMLIDEKADSTPDLPFASIPITSDPRDGFADVSYGQLAKAVNKCSWKIEEDVGKGRNFPTLGYMGPLDLRYIIFLLAAVKVGYKAFYSSHRNSLVAHLSLFERTECNIFFVGSGAPEVAHEVIKERPMRTFHLPELDYFLSQDECKRYPYSKSFAEARLEPLVVLHTSGSTGVPKPITMAHGTLAAIDAYHVLPSMGEKECIGPSWKGTRLFVAFPVFHAASMCYILGLGIYCGVVCVLPPPKTPLNAAIVDAIHTNADIQGSALPPAILIDIYRNPTYYKHIWPLKYMIFAGGPLPKDVGDQVSTKTRLTILTGSTEVGLPAIELPEDPHDWEYIAYSPVMGYEFRSTEVDGLSEQFIMRNEKFDLFQSIFSTFPHLNEFSLNDLYEEHPSKPGLYRLRGRADDIIVFSTAEKLNPVTMEQVISGHPAIRSALVAGHGRFQSSLLVELESPSSDPYLEAEMLEGIWQVVAQANQQCPTHGRIMRDFVIFSKPHKPFNRTAKGTVQRVMTLQAYREELDNLYEKGIVRPALIRKQAEGVEATLQQSLFEVVRKNTWLGDFSPTVDLYEQGLDSLQTMDLPKHINSFLDSQRPGLNKVTTDMIYAHPSIVKLAAAIESPISSQDSSSSRFSLMSDLLDQFVGQLLPPDTIRTPTQDGRFVILLTGSTGLIGSHFLDSILSMSSVDHVFCLCRGDDGKARQEKSHVQKGLSTKFNRVEFIKYNLSQPSLGLSSRIYSTIHETVTHIIHNAWDVNFNRSLESFVNSHLQGTKELLNLGARGLQRPDFLFVSTVATVNSASANHDSKPLEELSRNWNMTQASGYAESKLIAENLVAEMGKMSGNRTTICRVGQVTGATSGPGEWTRNDWLSALITTSTTISMIPNSLSRYDVVDWVPADSVGKVLLEILFPRRNGEIDSGNIWKEGEGGHNDPRFFHVTNPSVRSWQALIPAIKESYPHTLEVVPFTDWLSALQEHTAKNPRKLDKSLAASRLMSFFEHLAVNFDDQPVVLDTTRARKISETLRNQGSVTREWIQAWMRQWGLSSD